MCQDRIFYVFKAAGTDQTSVSEVWVFYYYSTTKSI